ncbi:MAG: tetratricopeptide repeat protein [Bacteroidales bacterium]|nr:tetratricopeptide repeat protein [Bacteroidales bacterium]
MCDKTNIETNTNQGGFQNFGGTINGNITINNYYTNPTDKKSADWVPRFRVPMAQNLIDRPDAVAALNELITNNQFVNLNGIGGSGKTSLMSLWANKHKDDYNQIAYAVVNNSVKDDIATQLNKTLKLPDFEKILDKYAAIMDYLSENYDSDKPNLMIVDINKALEKEVKDFVNEVVNEESLPLGWKCLVISRERKYGDKNGLFNLNDYEKENTEFLKELFLKKAGDGYKDFSDFDRLFKLLHNSPLLVEQLGIFLQDLPRKSFDDINELLHKDIFRNQKREGVTSKNRNESEEEQTIIGFLIRLVDFTQFKENEKELLRHFVLWPTDYISKKVIQGLLAGIIESEDAFEEVFFNLIKRGIITAQTNSNGEEEYKLHGLIAESIREQIEIKEEDYGQYCDNIDSIIEYNYWQFIHFAECIGHSLVNYDISDNHILLGNTANKLRDSFVFNLSKELYCKTLQLVEKKIEADKENDDLKNDLATAYNNLATLQDDYLQDYASAEENYKKAIEIGEQLPKENPEYQNSLERAYNNLANLQDDYLQDHASAEENYKKAIEIGERLPKENPGYQNGLARDYNNLAFLQMSNLQDYASAEENYKKAIEIQEQLPKENPEYQNDLASWYNNLAHLQQNCLQDYASAEENYKKAIEIGEQLPKENPEYQYYLARWYNNLAHLQQNCLQDYASAEENYKKAIEIGERLPKENPEYQNYLAIAYYNLALLQQDCLQDYASAEENFKKAIEIIGKLPMNNPIFKKYYFRMCRNYRIFCEQRDKMSLFAEVENKLIQQGLWEEFEVFFENY